MNRPGPVVIVGGGAAGTLAAIHVATRSAATRSRVPREIVVVEPAERLGEGVAYGTTSRSHLLNVRAAGMSAFPERPAHFTEWARGDGLTVDGTEFLPRMLYARYLRAAVADAESDGSAVRHVRARVKGLGPHEGGSLRVVLSEGADLVAGDVVLATGNALAPLPWLPDLPGIIRDPWAPGALEGVHPGARVVIVGSGLTAVDVVLTLRDRAHRAPVLLASSHGLLPQPHVAAVLPPRSAAVDPVTVSGARAPRPGAPRGCLRGQRLAPDRGRGTVGHGADVARVAGGRAATRAPARVPLLGGAPAPDGAAGLEHRGGTCAPRGGCRSRGDASVASRPPMGRSR